MSFTGLLSYFIDLTDLEASFLCIFWKWQRFFCSVFVEKMIVIEEGGRRSGAR